MKKVYLFCSNGMSTSILAGKMQEVADQHHLPMLIKAYPDHQIKEIMAKDKPDCILLGPQVQYMYDETKEKYGDMGVPISVIDQDDYGMMNGERILKKAILLIKQNKG